jgi:hypothetical protein
MLYHVSSPLKPWNRYISCLALTRNVQGSRLIACLKREGPSHVEGSKQVWYPQIYFTRFFSKKMIGALLKEAM